MRTLVTDDTYSKPSLSWMTKFTLTAFTISYFVTLVMALFDIRFGFSLCRFNKVGLLNNLTSFFVNRQYLSILQQPISSHVVDFPFLRCHRCSVTDNQISVRGSTTQLLITHRSLKLLPLRLLLQLLIFSCQYFLVSLLGASKYVLQQTTHKGRSQPTGVKRKMRQRELRVV